MSQAQETVQQAAGQTGLSFNVNVLAMGQALGGGVQVAMFASAAIIGTTIAPDPVMATLPITAFVVGGGIGVFPAAATLKRIGYKYGFGIAGLISTLAGILYSEAISIGSFTLFCVATAMLGVTSAFIQMQRFAASDLTPLESKPSAISRVMLGGVLAAVIGNLIAKSTEYLDGQTAITTPVMFGAEISALIDKIVGYIQPLFNGAVAYQSTGYAMSVACALYAALFFFLFRKGEARYFVDAHSETPPRPMGEIVRQPAFIAAVVAGAVGFSLMVLVMNAAPLAMNFCGIGFSTSTNVITAHVFAMFGPSLFTGRLIERYGVAPILYTGLVFMAGASAFAMSGQEVWQFYASLILLGLGWNFLFVGGSSLLTFAYRASERAKVQATNDFMVLSLNAVASGSSALAIHGIGWSGLAVLVLPILVVTMITFMIYLPKVQRA